MLDYLRGQRSGQSPDPDFEAKSLNALGLTTLDLVELISAQTNDRELIESQVREFIAIGRPPNRKLASLFQRVRILAESGLGEEQRYFLLTSGTIGDRSEIGPFPSALDTVGFVVKYCWSIERWCT